MTLMEFISKYNGQQGIGNTIENTGECVGLVACWVDELGLPHIWGHAKDLLVNADPNSFDKISNTPDAVPEPGDIIVWRQGFNGTFGHTAIVTKGNIKTFEVFEQNNPLGAGCRLHTYPDYAYVDGWLRVKKPIQPEVKPEIPAYFQGLLQENGLSLDNEPVMRSFFQKAIDYGGVVRDLVAANKTIAELKATEGKPVTTTSDGNIAVSPQKPPETPTNDVFNRQSIEEITQAQDTSIISDFAVWVFKKLFR